MRICRTAQPFGKSIWHIFHDTIRIFQATKAGLLLRRSQIGEERPYEFAHVCQILGTSALYANDIEYAESLLRRAIKVFEAQGIRQDYVASMSAAYLFVGLIAKSWLERNRRLEDG